MAQPSWSSTPQEVLESHGVTLQKGLSAGQVEKLRAEYGPNELDKEESTPLWKLVLQQFDDLLVKILLGAATLSFVLAFFEDGEEGLQAFVEPFVILLILILNAVVGVWQEHNAENALEALKQLQDCHCQCMRDGALVPDVPAADLVPGDVVHINVCWPTLARSPARARLCRNAIVDHKVSRHCMSRRHSPVAISDGMPEAAAHGGVIDSHLRSATRSRRTCASSNSRPRRCARMRAHSLVCCAPHSSSWVRFVTLWF